MVQFFGNRTYLCIHIAWKSIAKFFFFLDLVSKAVQPPGKHPAVVWVTTYVCDVVTLNILNLKINGVKEQISI